jgi:long-chain acyl-CoA synthetase
MNSFLLSLFWLNRIQNITARMVSPLEMFLKWENETPGAIMFQQPFAGIWKTWTYHQAGDEIRRVASGIKKLQLPDRSKIALLSKNCAHWIMADLAIIMTGHISIPLYPTLAAPTIKQILEHSEASVIIIGKLDNYDSQKGGIPSTVRRIGVAAYGSQENILWEDEIKINSPLKEVSSWNGDEILTIIYTSGTTGNPKGVMHSSSSFYSVVSTTFKDLKLPLHPRLFSYLPLSHIAERAGIEIYGLYSGALFSFAESLETFPRDILYVQPALFFAVPRIWAKFQEKILEKIPATRLRLLLSIPVLSVVIKKSIRKKLGLSQATHIYSGAAPISVELLEWYNKLGIVIFQAFGMTEDCIYSHFNRYGANKFGTVGKPLTGVTGKISNDGEIRLKNASLMKGYYKEPEMTREAFDEDGFLKTGDLGEYDNEGFLTITGRVKDQFKTDKGKYISPAPLETTLLANADIEQICVVGMGIPQPVALVVLSAAGKKKSKTLAEQSLNDSLSSINPTIQKYERIEKMIILKNDWTIENGLITPTLKVKRNEVEKLNLRHYSRWYSMEGTVLWE